MRRDATMRLSKKYLERCATVRLYTEPKSATNPGGSFWVVPYRNAKTGIAIPLNDENIDRFFKNNGRGVPFACGISNACLDNKGLFPHPVIYVQTYGCVTYIVVATEKGGMTPSFAIRYSHSHGRLVNDFDELGA